MADKQRILVVEDDLSILTGVSMNLKFEGYDVEQAQDGADGLQKAINTSPDLVVLDVMLPKMNGLEVIKELRARGLKTPVIVLSARGQEPDKIMGLNLGADDYVVKPFGLNELLARIKAVLRRHMREQEPIEFDGIRIDLAARTVTQNGEPVPLTAQELKLMLHFAQNPGQTFNRDELLQAAWGYGYEGTVRTVDNFISQLRARFEKDPNSPRHFVTVRGMGYRFEP